MKTKETVKPEYFYAGVDEEQAVMQKYKWSESTNEVSVVNWGNLAKLVCQDSSQSPFFFGDEDALFFQIQRVTFLLLIFSQIPQFKIFTMPGCYILVQPLLNPISSFTVSCPAPSFPWRTPHFRKLSLYIFPLVQTSQKCTSSRHT